MWLFLFFAAIPVNEATLMESGRCEEISGFLVKDSQGDCFLAETPKVRSCCLGKGKIAEMKVEGLAIEAPYPLHAVIIRGTIERDQGRLILKNAQFQESSSMGYAWFVWVLCGSGIIFGWRKLRGS